MRRIIIVAHDIRSSHNIGSLLRTAEGLGVDIVYLTGYSPYPRSTDDSRLPHIANKVDKAITKTALGAEHSQKWQYHPDILDLLRSLKNDNWQILALEQSPDSVQLPDFRPPDKTAILLGREVEGIEPAIVACADTIVEIPMYGTKESFNVVQAAAMALYHCRFVPTLETT